MPGRRSEESPVVPLTFHCERPIFAGQLAGNGLSSDVLH
jgi:hypothetical protein